MHSLSGALCVVQVQRGPRASRLSIVSDFLVFCKLLLARGLVPPGAVTGAAPGAAVPGWSWSAMLEAAGGMLDRGFHPEKCGAVHRYGPTASGDAMRTWATTLYDEEPEVVEAVRAEIEVACWGDDEADSEGHMLHCFSFDREPEAFADVGGVRLWKGLNDTLKAGRLG